jgi:hypothetical protein
MRAFICGALLALATTTAGAEEDRYSPNYWLPYCKAFISTNNRDPLSQGICVGRIEGVAFASCANIPDAVTRGQIVRVVVRNIETRPQRMHEPFLPLAREAVVDAWPCKP